ncbi:autotransporter outer membrane beta-barrel domain-containing protein [Rhizobium straminoryzae]|uniref:Autotransporter domain-containing protein n=1 Tax=Rhizobium straminoryzae TaxID=1387186 RepID=A0A549TC03_9HYPH|nr:autotransporter domain-containing protein [Rhizobium straminoryzae]TRL39402.1 autotransporter domain-containing protein [Rhizobium straminoryzae]
MAVGRLGPGGARLWLSTALASGLTVLAAPPAVAQSISSVWTGTSDSSFTNGANWSTTPRAPGAADAAEIGTGVAIVSSGAAVSTLAVDGGTLRVPSTLTVGNGTSLSSGLIEVLVGGRLASDVTVTGGVLSNSGTLDGDLSLSGGSAVNDGTISGDTRIAATFTNNGTLGTLIVTSGGIATNNATGHVLGATDLAGGTLTNNGTLSSVSVASGAIFVNNSGATAGTLTNAGTASNGGNLAALVNTAGSFTNNTGGTVSGASSVTGGTLTNNATLAAVTVGPDGLFTNNAGATAGAISNAGNTTNSGTLASLANTSGRFTNNTGGSVTGTTSITGGTVTNNASLASVSVGAGGSLVNNSAGSTGAVVNAGSMTNGGTVASLTNTGGDFDNTGSITGAASVSGGMLTNDGTVLGAVTVSGSGILSGTGSVASLSVGSGGTLSPGPGLATLSVTGNLTLGAGSTYQADIASTGVSDRITVGGTATLGGTLALEAASQVYDPSVSYTLLTATGGVSGTFASVTSDFAFLSPLVTYGAGSLTLDLDRNAVAFSSYASTANARAAANAADALPANDGLHLAVQSMSRADAATVFERLDGDLHASLKSQLLEDGQFQREALRERMQVRHEGKDGFWAAVFGGNGHIDGDGNAEEVKSRLKGALLGADALLFDNSRFEGGRVGVVVGASRSHVSEPQGGDHADVDAYHAGLYGSTWFGPVTLSGGALWSGNSISTRRSIDVGSLSQVLTSDYHGDTAQVFAELSSDIRAGDATLTPFANIAHVRLWTDGFAEQGGSAALSGSNSIDEVTVSTLGLRVATDLPVAELPMALTAELGWRHVFGDLSPDTTLAYGGGQRFTVGGVSLPRDAAVLKAGIEARLSSAMRLTFNWNGIFSADEISNTARLALSVSF